MVINCFLKTSPLLFVFTLWVSLLHICTICCIAVAWQWHWSPFCPSGTEEGHGPPLLSHSPPPWQLLKLQEGNILTLKRWAAHYNSPAPSMKTWALPLLAPGAGKRGESFCPFYSHRCSLENLNRAFAKQEPSPGLCFSEAENRHLLWETDLKNASDTVLLKSFFSSLCMIFKMPCQMDVSFTRYFFLGVMNEVTLINFILSDGEHEKILYLYCTVQ